MTETPGALLFLAGFVLAAPAAAAPDYGRLAAAARATLAAMVAADTSNPPGNEQRIVELVVPRLREAGVPYEVTTFAPGRQNVVARLKGAGGGTPVMLLAHLDVVGADGQAWTAPPHALTEKDGFLYGRGTGDMLGMAAVNLEVFLELARARTPLRRDVILALTGDEESGGQGMRYLLAHASASVDAGFVLNEGGAPALGEDGKVRYVKLQGAEKTYQDFELSAAGRTGHSSVPLPDNAITRLAGALSRVGAYRFPARLNAVTRGYFAARADVEPDPRLAAAMRSLAAASGKLPEDALAVIDGDLLLAPNLRTTCTATLVSGGTRVNALPADAKANVNCRILPDETPAQVRAALERVVADPQVAVRPVGDFERAGASPVSGPDIETARKVIAATWGGVPVVPTMMFGATDSRFLRQAGIPAYGLSPIATSDADARRAHGVDERIPAASLRSGVEFLHRLVVALAGERGR